MKGLNVKRIAALAAGAAILGATLAYAGAVTYSNTPIISADGSPQVKVVVGANAAASDGVAAANIAALIGNLAFKSQDVTATVGGLAGLGCTVSGAGGAGTCAVSNEKVTLDVTVPGTISGVYQFNTYINDFIDKKLENRNYTSTDDKYDTPVDETPFYYTGVTQQAIRKVTSTDFPALQSPSVTDTYANEQYTESQTLWLWGTAKYDTSQKQLALETPSGAYQIEFTQDQAGVPAGTCDATSIQNLDTNYQNVTGDAGNYNLCADSDRTDRHRVHVGFLGDTYIISAMNPPDDATCAANLMFGSGPLLNSATDECAGGSINMAKESAYNTVHVGENLTAGAYSIKLEDIEAPLGNGNPASASIAIYDSTGTLLKEDKINPTGGSYSYSTPDGSKLRIRVYKTNPGYYAYAKWAEMAVYSQEFTMTDGQELNSDNTDWSVKLVWRNKDPTYASKSADALRKIILYGTSVSNPSTTTGYYYSSDSFNIITSPVAWNMQFGGLSLGSGDYDNLQITMHGPADTIQVQTNFNANCNAAATQDQFTDGDYVEFHSTIPSAFELNGGALGTFEVQDFYLVVNASNSLDIPEGRVLFKKPTGSCYYNMTAAMYYLGGDASSDDSGMYYINSTGSGTNPMSWTTQYPAILLQESASATSGARERDYWILPIYTVTDGSSKFLPTSAATSEIYYAGVIDAQRPITSPAEAPAGYYSERGSYISNVASDSILISRAKKLGEMKFFVKSPGANATTATTVGPLGEGESYNVGSGVTIKVDNITETVGTCTAGPNAVCTVTGQSGLTATPSVTAANVRVALNPASAPLVVLDSQADTSATLIVVGGPAVNTVAKDAMTGSSLTLTKAGDYIAQPIGNNRILVAGYNAADTGTAADKFITDLIAAAH